MAAIEQGPFAKTKSSMIGHIILDVAFVVACVFVLGGAIIYAGLQLYGVKFYEITSPSMTPSFAKGAVVGVKSIAPHQIKENDVIAFKREGFSEPYIHRVMRIQSDPDLRAIYKKQSGEVIRTTMTYSPRIFYTKGDANNVEDPGSTPQSNLIGKELFVVPWPFNLIVTQFNKRTLFVIGVAAIGLFVAWELVDAGLSLRRRRAASTPPTGF